MKKYKIIILLIIFKLYQFKTEKHVKFADTILSIKNTTTFA